MSDKQKYCSGCRNDFYNGRQNISGDKCWSLADAKVVSRVFIHRDQPPPYRNLKAEKTLACWYGDTGMRAVDPASIGKDGYWKL